MLSEHPGRKGQSHRLAWRRPLRISIPITGAVKFQETGAPYDALYFLANAYRIANDFDKALETYELFLEDVDTGDV